MATWGDVDGASRLVGDMPKPKLLGRKVTVHSNNTKMEETLSDILTTLEGIEALLERIANAVEK